MKTPRIIVVEDKAIIALDIMRFLIRNGYKNTRYYLNGTDALKAIKNAKPDLAILDVILHSNVTGIDIAEELKKVSVPFIFISALSQPGHRQAISKLKPAAVFLKPVNLNEVLLEVRKLFTLNVQRGIRTSNSLH